MQIFANNDYLAEVPVKNPVSTRSAIMNVAAIGITLNLSASETSCGPEYGVPCMERSLLSLRAIMIFGTHRKMGLVHIWHGLTWTINNR